MCLLSRRPQEATGRQTLSIQGWRREKAGRLARVPGLVTAGGPGNPRSHTLAEMAGGEDRRVVGTLHLLLATVLSLTAGILSPVSAAWTQEKVRGRCCVLYLSDYWRVPGPGTRPPSPGLAGDGSGMLSPAQTPSPHSAPGKPMLSLPSLGARAGLGVALESPRGWVMSPAFLWLHSDGGADRRRKYVSLTVEEKGHGGATARSRPSRPALAPGCLDCVPRVVPAYP